MDYDRCRSNRLDYVLARNGCRCVCCDNSGIINLCVAHGISREMCMKNELYATLRERIVKVVPEIMELKFGCRFKWMSDKVDKDGEFIEESYTVFSAYEYEDVLSGKDGFSIYAVKKGETQTASFDSPFDYEDGQTFFDFAEILGRDITLADVLRAIDTFCEIDSNGSFLTYKDGEQYERSPKEWDFVSPLHEQSDELGEWLLTFIK